MNRPKTEIIITYWSKRTGDRVRVAYRNAQFAIDAMKGQVDNGWLVVSVEERDRKTYREDA